MLTGKTTWQQELLKSNRTRSVFNSVATYLRACPDSSRPQSSVAHLAVGMILNPSLFEQVDSTFSVLPERWLKTPALTSKELDGAESPPITASLVRFPAPWARRWSESGRPLVCVREVPMCERCLRGFVADSLGGWHKGVDGQTSVKLLNSQRL